MPRPANPRTVANVMTQPILIAGGGIGGLTAALGLAQRGLPVTVLERSSVFAEIGKVFNLVATCHNDAAEPVAGRPVTQEEVLEGFRHVHARAQDIIRHGIDWKMWVLCDRDPVDRWVDGRVALLGDAAHPTLQYLAQGACMAVEDSVCLADELAAQPGDIEAALESYCRRRVLRTTRVVIQSRAIGDHIYHPAGAHATLRNAIMQAKSANDWLDTMAWLYGSTDQAC